MPIDSSSAQTVGRNPRVLFFAWGDSIHARRRIGIFAADSGFDVGVVSTFAYDFEGVQNYYLAGSGRPVSVGWFARSLIGKLLILAVAGLMVGLSKLAGKQILIEECRRVLFDLLLVRRYVAQFKPDVIFLQTLMYPSYLSYFLGRKIPEIVTFWNGDVTWWAEWTGVERAFKHRIVKHGSRKAAAITVNSLEARQACLAYGVDADKVHLIRYPGVDLEVFCPWDDVRVARFGLLQRLGLSGRRVLLCPRGLGDYLNSDVIVEAAARVASRYPNVLFLFLAGAGDDVWSEHLERASELGIEDNIHRVRHVSWQDMPDYYRAADAMISIASKDSLPNCMLEAMACGVPVVMGDIPQIANWVVNGRNGYLVPPRDAEALASCLLDVLDEHNEKLPDFIRRNLALVKREVDSESMARQIKSLVRAVAGDLSGCHSL